LDSIVIGDIFRCDIQYDTDHTAGGGVECKLYIVIIILFWDFTWYNVVYISPLVLGIGVTSGQYYWI